MTSVPMTIFQVWLLAIRPKTLAAAIVPVAIGVALSARIEELNWGLVACIFLSAICIQIGTNLANDYSDFKSGADTRERLGPTRVTQAGLLSPRAVISGAITFFAAAVLFGIPLIARGGWPVLVIGVIGIVCGYLYTGGPYPLGYNGLGELFVLIFFGILAVAGTSYVLTLAWLPESFVLGLCPGLLSSALLAVNNLRDIDTDRKAGKRTLAVRFGRGFARAEVLLTLIAPFVVLAIAIAHFQLKMTAWLAVLSLPLAVPVIRTCMTKTDGPLLNAALVKTAKVNMAFGVLLVIGLSL